MTGEVARVTAQAMVVEATAAVVVVMLEDATVEGVLEVLALKVAAMEEEKAVVEEEAVRVLVAKAEGVAAAVVAKEMEGLGLGVRVAMEHECSSRNILRMRRKSTCQSSSSGVRHTSSGKGVGRTVATGAEAAVLVRVVDKEAAKAVAMVVESSVPVVAVVEAEVEAEYEEGAMAVVMVVESPVAVMEAERGGVTAEAVPGMVETMGAAMDQVRAAVKTGLERVAEV